VKGPASVCPHNNSLRPSAAKFAEDGSPKAYASPQPLQDALSKILSTWNAAMDFCCEKGFPAWPPKARPMLPSTRKPENSDSDIASYVIDTHYEPSLLE